MPTNLSIGCAPRLAFKRLSAFARSSAGSIRTTYSAATRMSLRSPAPPSRAQRESAASHPEISTRSRRSGGRDAATHETRDIVMTNELTGLTGRAVRRLGDTPVLPIGLGCQAMSGVTAAHLNELRRCASDAHRLFRIGDATDRRARLLSSAVRVLAPASGLVVDDSARVKRSSGIRMTFSGISRSP